jgi:hypothetical protein
MIIIMDMEDGVIRRVADGGRAPEDAPGANVPRCMPALAPRLEPVVSAQLPKPVPPLGGVFLHRLLV